jgi:hypothetical protein
MYEILLSSRLAKFKNPWVNLCRRLDSIANCVSNQGINVEWNARPLAGDHLGLHLYLIRLLQLQLEYYR